MTNKSPTASGTDCIAVSKRRQQCDRCLRPQSHCYCDLIQTVASPPVLFIQHPLEAGNSKNTARLAHLCLPNSRLLITETLTQDMQTEYLHDYDNLLLYPSDTQPSPQQAQNPSHTVKAKQLIVIDGTWRKSRKLLHLNPCLQALPRLSLAPNQPSIYTIRKAHTPTQLSTLEATAAALTQLPTGLAAHSIASSCSGDSTQASADILLSIFKQWQARLQRYQPQAPAEAP